MRNFNVHPLADSERENGANWSLAKIDPGVADINKVEAELAEIGLYMQREYAIEEDDTSVSGL